MEDQSIEQLIVALEGDDYYARQNATKALHQIGEPAVRPLIAALKNASNIGRSNIAEVLGEIRDKQAVEPLIVALKKDENAVVRMGAALALGKLGDLRAIEPLIAAFRDGERYVRSYAATALGRIGKSAVEQLIAALNDERGEVRANAVAALGKIGDQRAIDPLIAVLNDRQDDVRMAAAASLGEIGDKRAIEPLVIALKDENYRVRRDVAFALCKMGDKRAFEELGEMLTSEDRDFRERIITTLRNIGIPAAEPLTAALKNKYADVRYEAAIALSEIRDKRAVKPLIAALKDEPYVAEAAARALSYLGERRFARIRFFRLLVGHIIKFLGVVFVVLSCLFSVLFYSMATRSDEELPEDILLDAPAQDADSLGIEVTFHWHIVAPRKGMTYSFTLIIDKGTNPFDGNYEHSLDVGDKTEQTVFLQRNERYEWAVVGRGGTFYKIRSEVRKLYTGRYFYHIYYDDWYYDRQYKRSKKP